MKKEAQSLEAFVIEQIGKWKALHTKIEREKEARIPVITVSMEPGSGGCYVAKGIGDRGRSVVVGRGANYILPPEKRLSVRITAPLEQRVQNAVQWFDVSADTAKRRILHRESRRRAFIRESFHCNIADPLHYDLVINMARLNTESAVDSVIGAVMGRIGQKEENGAFCRNAADQGGHL